MTSRSYNPSQPHHVNAQEVDAAFSYLENRAINTPFFHPSATFYIDPVNGNDAWDGQHATHVGLQGPKKTLGALLREVAPSGVWEISKDTVLYVMNDTPAATDKQALNVHSRNGAHFTVASAYNGTGFALYPVTGATGTLTVTARNRATATPWSATLSHAGDVTANVGNFLYDKTVNAWCVIDKDLGSNAGRLSEPVAPPSQTSSTSYPGPTRTALVTGDSYQLYRGYKLNLTRIDFTSDSLGASGRDQGKLIFWGIWFPYVNAADSLYVTLNPLQDIGTIAFHLCRFDITVTNSESATDFTACALLGGYYATPSSSAYIMACSIQGLALFNGSDSIFSDTIITQMYNISVHGSPSFGSVGLFDITSGVLSVGDTVPAALKIPHWVWDSTRQLWGTLTVIDLNTGSSIQKDTAIGTWVSVITACSGFRFMGSITQGFTSNRTTAGGTIAGAVSTTWANCDSAGDKAIFDLATGARACLCN